MESRGYARLSIEMVQNGSSLILGPISVLKCQQMETQEAKVQKLYANCIEINGNLWVLLYFSREVASDFVLCSCVAISWNFKMRLGPLWTNLMMGVAHPLLFL